MHGVNKELPLFVESLFWDVDSSKLRLESDQNLLIRRILSDGSWDATQWLVALADLACMKLNAVAQRGSKKDFFDVYLLVDRHRPLDELLELYEKKYAATDRGHLLQALVYFDEADDEAEPEMQVELSWPEVKRSLRERVGSIAG